MSAPLPTPGAALTRESLAAAVPGARSFSFAGWLARLPLSTVGLGSVLLVAAEIGSYGLAGLVSGTLALASAVGGPQWARAMDRLGLP